VDVRGEDVVDVLARPTTATRTKSADNAPNDFFMSVSPLLRTGKRVED